MIGRTSTAEAGGRVVRDDLGGALEALACRHVVAGEVLLGLDVRAVGHGRDAVAHPYGLPDRRVGERHAAAQKLAGVGELLEERVGFAHQLVAFAAQNASNAPGLL